MSDKRPRRYLTKARLTELLVEPPRMPVDAVPLTRISKSRRLNLAMLADLPDAAKLPARMVGVLCYGADLCKRPRFVKVRVHLPGRHSMLLWMETDAYFGLQQFP